MSARQQQPADNRSKQAAQSDAGTAVKHDARSGTATYIAILADAGISRFTPPNAGHRAKLARAIAQRTVVLRGRNFRRFYIGYATSLLGTSMSAVGVTFAVLDGGGTPADLGYVMAARIVPQVMFVLGGGVLADRLGRRPAMLGSDALCCAAQATLAAVLLAGRPHIWLFALLAALVGTGEAFFDPALGGLAVEVAPREELGSANALRGLAQSVAVVVGPSLAGLLVAVAGPAAVIAIDAASYGVSMAALALLRLPQAGRGHRRSLLREAGEGWAEFRSRTWLWVTTLQFALFNLITWAPYLLLGPVLARDYLGGARAWGVIMAANGAGSILGGLAALGRRPRRPLVVATVATFGYPVPCLLLALHAPAYGVGAGAFAAGLGGTLFSTFWTTALQQQVPAARLSRASSFVTFGAFGPGTLGLAIAGPAAALAGASHVLAAGAAWAVLSSLVVLLLPSIRAITWLEDGAG
jgi:predicted MFS family arabinose efflux permease